MFAVDLPAIRGIELLFPNFPADRGNNGSSSEYEGPGETDPFGAQHRDVHPQGSGRRRHRRRPCPGDRPARIREGRASPPLRSLSQSVPLPRSRWDPPRAAGRGYGPRLRAAGTRADDRHPSMVPHGPGRRTRSPSRDSDRLPRPSSGAGSDPGRRLWRPGLLLDRRAGLPPPSALSRSADRRADRRVPLHEHRVRHPLLSLRAQLPLAARRRGRPPFARRRRDEDLPPPLREQPDRQDAPLGADTRRHPARRGRKARLGSASRSNGSGSAACAKTTSATRSTACSSSTASRSP